MESETKFDYDLLVIGGGSGGMAAAKAAAQHNKRVGLIEKQALGGTCANRGCIPKKLMFYAAQLGREQHLAKSFAWSDAQQTLNWSQLRHSIQGHIQEIQTSIQESLEDTGIEIIEGEASFQGKHHLHVRLAEGNNRVISACHIVIATGSQPMQPDIEGIELAWTSRDIFKLDRLPQSLCIIGGGYIGVELGQILNALGVRVAIVERGAQILDGFDQDIRSRLQQNLQNQGIELYLQASLSHMQRSKRGLRVEIEKSSKQDIHLKDGHGSHAISASVKLEYDAVLVATGREPNLDGLKLSAAGITVEKGAIAVNAQSCTSQPHIYAVGDCTARLPLTPAAKAEGEAVIQTIYAQQPTSVDYRWIPSAVYASPPAASIGWTEEKAKQAEDVEVHQITLSPLKYALADHQPPNMIKFIVSKNSHKVLGLHVVGEPAADLVQIMAPAIQAGLPFHQIQETIAIHPTFGEELLSF